LTELPSERFLKKLIGKTDVENELKRLEKWTQEETRMATVQMLKATRTIDDRVAALDDHVAGVHHRVASAFERVEVVDDKVTEVIDGAQPSFLRWSFLRWS
jgi:hypothetical protein